MVAPSPARSLPGVCARTRAVGTAIELAARHQSAEAVTGCDHLEILLEEIRHSIDLTRAESMIEASAELREAHADEVAADKVRHTVRVLHERSRKLRELVSAGQIRIVGAVYDVRTGALRLL